MKNTGMAAAGFMIVPRHVLGGPGFIAPSDKLNIAGIGIGGKGQSDIASFAESPNVNIVSLCDVDDRQAIASREAFPKASYFSDFREMLEKEGDNIVGTKKRLSILRNVKLRTLGRPTAYNSKQ